MPYIGAGIQRFNTADGLTVSGSTELDGAVVVNESSADADFRVESNGNANMLFVDAGNDRVGIGTNAPAHDVEIVATAAGSVNDSLQIRNNATSSGTGSRIRFINSTDNTSDANGASISSVRNGDDNDLVFETENATRMTIDHAGNVGIGETSPDTKLHLTDHTANSGPVIRLEGDSQDTAGNLLGGIECFNADASGDGPNVVSAIKFLAHSSIDHGGQITFSTHDGTEGGEGSAPVERARIDEDGNVGIGTTSPTQPLSISANGANGLFLLRDEGDAADSCRLFFDSSNTRYALFAKDGVLSVRSGGTPGSSSGTERVQFTVNGINSSGVAGNTTVSSANLFISGGNNFQKSTSSRRYKTNITDATHGLSDVLNLRSVTYKGVNDGETVFGGLIAEEVHDAGLTEFVNYSQDDDGNDIPEGVHYGHMVALAFKAIQELKTELDAEKAKTATLQTQVADLTTRLTALEDA
jgi:hypothetical protein